MLRVLARRAAIVFGSSAAGVTVGEHYAPDSGFGRSFRFWRGVLPMYTHYKYVEWVSENSEDVEAVSERYHQLNRKYSPVMRDLTLDLQGFYLKLAQVVSTRDEFIPAEYMEWCKKLQNANPCALPAKDIHEIITRELGLNDISDEFEWFEEIPLGAASIGQVHRAKLKNSGRPVVVKVQYPGVEAKFRNDIATVEAFCAFLMPQNKPFFNEIKKQFQTEFDYVGEAKNLAEVRANLSAAGFSEMAVVPLPRLDMCTKSVLVMDYLPGETMIEGVRNSYKRFAAASGKNFEELEAEQKLALEDGTLQRKDLRTACQDHARTEAFLSWADFMRNICIFGMNWTVAPIVKGRGAGWSYYHSERPVNLAHIMEVLLRVHAHEIFIDGVFNGDPHPGNVLLMPDGRLGLIDYGQVKRMSESDRIIYAKLQIALSRDDREEVVRLMTEEVGFRTRDMNKDIIYRVAAFWNDRDTDDVTMGMNVHTFMEYLDKSDPPVKVNDEFIMVGRVSILLRGVANAFGLKIRVSDYWSEEAKRFLQSRGIAY
jgi:aarF domain-containing kinase